MRTCLSCILRTDVLAYFLRVDPRSLCVDVYLEIFGDCVDEMPEIWPHFDHNQVLPALIARPAVHLRNQVEVLEAEYGGKF